MTAYPDFIEQATDTPACRDHDTELFFPPPGDRGYTAKAICRRCPLLNTCRTWANAQPLTELYGIWGGLSDVDRRRIKRTQRAEQAAGKPAADECRHCGTYVGKYRHIHMARRHPNLAVAA